VVREIIASRIIAAARFGERNPVRLLEAALCGRTFFRRLSSVACAQSARPWAIESCGFSWPFLAIVWFPTPCSFALWIVLPSPLEGGGQSVEKRGKATRAAWMRKHTQGPYAAMSDNNESKPAPALGPAVMRAIGLELRANYADIIAEGVPERFIAILRRLDEASDEDSTFVR
jgi:Anti-sigma factor NepR